MSDMETREVKLGNIVKHNKGYAFKSSEYTDKGVMVVRVTDFTLDSISDADAVYLAPDDRYDKFILKTNDILIQTVGSWANNPNSIVGKVVRVPKQCDNAYLNQNIVRIIPNNDLDNTYLFYALKANHFSTYCVLRGQGAANQASITLDTIFRFKFKAHNFTAQKRIAGILSAYDNLIENNNKRIRLLEQMAENLYKEWFVRFRFPGYEGVEFENGLPKEWEYTKLEGLANISTGKCNREDAEEDGAYPLFDRSQEIKRSNVWLKDCEAIIVPGEGTSFIPRYYNGKFNLHQRCYCVEPLEKGMGFFLYQTLMMYRIYFLYVATGATVPSLRLNNFNDFKVLLPKKELCFQYNEIAEKMNDEILLLKNKNELLAKQRDMLLPRLMSGKLEF